MVKQFGIYCIYYIYSAMQTQNPLANIQTHTAASINIATHASTHARAHAHA